MASTEVAKPDKAKQEKLAKERATNIRNMLESATLQFVTIVIQLGEAKQSEEWKLLGYATFADYIKGEFGPTLAKLDAAFRKSIVKLGEVKHAGLSAPDLAALTGASRATIERDKAKRDDRKSPQMRGKPTSEVDNSKPVTPADESPTGEPASDDLEVIDGEAVEDEELADYEPQLDDAHITNIYIKAIAALRPLIEDEAGDPRYVDGSDQFKKAVGILIEKGWIK